MTKTMIVNDPINIHCNTIIVMDLASKTADLSGKCLGRRIELPRTYSTTPKVDFKNVDVLNRPRH